MPAGKAQQSNAMLYTLIAFVAIAIISVSFAVIFYVKSEEYRTLKDNAEKDLEKLAKRSEQSKLSDLVGTIPSGQSVVGTMAILVNDMVEAVTGDPAEDINAVEKVNSAKIAINNAITSLKDGLGNDAIFTAGEQGNIDLLDQIADLKSKLEDSRQKVFDLEDMMRDLQADFDEIKAVSLEKEQTLVAQKDEALKLADETQSKFDELKALMDQSRDEQIQLITDKLDAAKVQITEKNTLIEELQNQLLSTDSELQNALRKLEAIKPRPDIEVAAFESDAKIIRIDSKQGIVYLNIGSDDHVYKGLTFSVYDSSIPIPEDGKGKAEIEVFSVEKNVSAARINEYSVKNPIVQEDIVANLIWNSKISNKFVVVGEFDFNKDGRIEKEGIEKVRQLIERWGGQITNSVKIDTDFIIIGDEPKSISRPTADELDANPSLQQQYEESLASVEIYDRVLTQAANYSIPVFNQKRFLRLIGYDTLASKSSPF